MTKKKDPERCMGVNVSGYFRGYRCGNDGKYIGSDGSHYCASHLTIAEKNPERFEQARAALERGWE